MFPGPGAYDKEFSQATRALAEIEMAAIGGAIVECSMLAWPSGRRALRELEQKLGSQFMTRIPATPSVRVVVHQEGQGFPVSCQLEPNGGRKIPQQAGAPAL